MTYTKSAFAKKTLAVIMSIVLFAASFTLAGFSTTQKASAADTAYLFAYFTSNSQYGQKIRFAVSQDGYNFNPLNSNKPVITQTKGSSQNSSGYARDPYILKAHDGSGYYIIATDMDAAVMHSSWSGDTCMVTWYSQDLINWEQKAVIDVASYSGFETTIRTWAPQAIWDESKQMYMIYWANYLSDWSEGVYYAYTSDFVTMSAPQLLYKPSSGAAIDADIIYDGSGTYYLYYKDESNATVGYVTSSSLTGTYSGFNGCSKSSKAVEGNSMYQIAGTDTWVMMLDEYLDSNFVLQQTTDFKNFTLMNSSDYNVSKCSARHGSVVHISTDEYNSLVSAFGMTESNNNSFEYSFTNGVNSTNGWEYTTVNDVSGHTYDFCLDSNNTPGSNSTASVVESDGIVTINQGNLFINDADARSVMKSSAFTISFDHKLIADKPNSSSSLNYKDTGVIAAISDPDRDYIRLRENGELSVWDGTQYVVSPDRVEIPTGTEASYKISFDGTKVDLYINGLIVSTVNAVPAAASSTSGTFYLGLGFSDAALADLGCHRTYGTYSALRFSDVPVENDLETMYQTAVSSYKNLLKSNVLYKNSADIYNAFVDAEEYYDSYKYGEDNAASADSVINAVATLNAKMLVMERFDAASITSAVGSWTQRDATPDYSPYYANLIYAPETVGANNGEGSYAGKSDTVQTGSSWTGSTRQTFYSYYSSNVMIYDGVTTPKMAIMNGTNPTRTGTWGVDGRIYTMYLTGNDGLELRDVWYGYDGRTNFAYTINNPHNSKCDYLESNPSGGYAGKFDGFKYMANVLYFNGSFGAGEYAKTINPSWGAYCGNSDGNKHSATWTCTWPIYVLNYKPLHDYLSTHTVDFSAIDSAKEGGMKALLECYDAITAVDGAAFKNSTDQTLANDVAACEQQIKTATQRINANPTVTQDSGQYDALRAAITNATLKTNNVIYNGIKLYTDDSFNAYMAARQTAIDSINAVIGTDYQLSYNGASIGNIAKALADAQAALTKNKCDYTALNQAMTDTTTVLDESFAEYKNAKSYEAMKDAFDSALADAYNGVITSEKYSSIEAQAVIDSLVSAVQSSLTGFDNSKMFSVTFNVDGRVIADQSMYYQKNTPVALTVPDALQTGSAEWADDNGNKINNDGYTYTFVPNRNITINCTLSAAAAADTVGVTVMTRFDTEYAQFAIASSKTVADLNTYAKAQKLVGYTFSKWLINGTDYSDDTVISTISSDTIVMVPQYIALGSYVFDEFLVRTATQSDFVCWAIKSSDNTYRVVSYKSRYIYYATGAASNFIEVTQSMLDNGSIILESNTDLNGNIIPASSDNLSAKLPFASMRGVAEDCADTDGLTWDQSINKLTSVCQFTNGSGYDIISCGAQMMNTQSGKSTITKSSSQTTSNQYLISYDFSKAPAGVHTFKIRSYVIYTKDGSEVTSYSDWKTITITID